jgi:hypothetical protein
MKKTKIAAAVLLFAIPGSALAADGVKSIHHRLADHRHVHRFGAQPYGGASLVAPRGLDHRDATRPGGLDPSFNPPPS